MGLAPAAFNKGGFINRKTVETGDEGVDLAFPCRAVEAVGGQARLNQGGD